MKKMVLLLSVIASFFVLTGCTSSVEQVEEVEQARKARQMTVVSSGNPRDVLPAFKTFTWNENYSIVLSAINDDSEKDIRRYIRHKIISYLKTKGYVYQPDPIQADVVIGFLFALEDDLADKKIQSQFGLLPGVNSSTVTDKRYEKGTFLLAVLDTELKTFYWRSAMQGFVDFDEDKKGERADAMNTVLDFMMSGFPKAGQ